MDISDFQIFGGFYFLLVCWCCIFGFFTYLAGKNKNINGFLIGFFITFLVELIIIYTEFWFFIFIPFITIFIILCIPCRNYQQNQTLIFTQKKKELNVTKTFDDYIDNLTLIEKLAKLKNSGAVTEDEFMSEKRKILR